MGDRLRAWLDEQDRTLPSESRDWYKANRALRAVVELCQQRAEPTAGCADAALLREEIIGIIEREVFGAE
jgi:hypothetical protein